MIATILNRGVVLTTGIGETEALKDYDDLIGIITEEASKEFYKIISREKNKNYDINIEISIRKINVTSDK